MSKKSQGRAFFEILAEERREAQEKQKQEAEEKPAPIVRRYGDETAPAAEPAKAHAPPPPPAPPPAPPKPTPQVHAPPPAPPKPAPQVHAPPPAPPKPAPQVHAPPPAPPKPAPQVHAPPPAPPKPAPQVHEPPPPPPPPKPAPLVQAPPVRAPQVPITHAPAPQPTAKAPRKPFLWDGNVTLSYFWLAIAGVIVVWAIGMSFLLGWWLGGRKTSEPPLPVVNRRPTFDELRARTPTGGLVDTGGAPTTGGIKPPTTGGVKPPPTSGVKPPVTGGVTPPVTGGIKPPVTGGIKPPVTGGGTPPPTGAKTDNKWRVRVARLALSNPEYTDKLRSFLQRNGVETELELRRQFYYLYSQERFVKEDEAGACATKVNQLLRRFARETTWGASADAFPVRMD